MGKKNEELHDLLNQCIDLGSSVQLILSSDPDEGLDRIVGAAKASMEVLFERIGEAHSKSCDICVNEGQSE
jgi:hypothetical protein